MKIYNPDNTLLTDADISDDSHRLRELMGQHNVTLHVSYTDAIRIKVGCYIDYQGVRYTLRRKPIIEKHGERNLEYTLIFESPQILADKRVVRNLSTKKYKFPLTATPKEHIQLIVDNLNLVDSGWKVGDCIVSTHALVSYNHTKCLEALKTIADTFKTEYEIDNKTVHLRKVEYNKENPLVLAYGKGNGFKTGLRSEPTDSNLPIEELAVQAGSRNIDASKNDNNAELLLPKGQTLRYDGAFFEDQDGFDQLLARTYIVDDEGLTIRRADKEQTTFEQGSTDLSNIYPMRIGTVTKVEVTEKGNYNIYDNTIPANLDYSKYRIKGEKMIVAFQSGILSSREFNLMQTEDKVTGYVHNERKFMLESQEMEGQMMPNEIWAPKVGDTYAVFGMMMPDEYIRDDASKSGASWDLFREACRIMFEEEQDKITFSGELDGLWTQRDWLNISGKIKIGGYVRFTDHQIVDTEWGEEPETILIRQTIIKDFINTPHKPEITLANTSVATFNSDFRKIPENEVKAESDNQNTVNLVKRTWRGAMELINKLYDPSGSFQQNLVSSLAVQAMVGLFGDKLLQFSFWDSSFTKETEPIITFDKTVKQLSCNKAYVRHDTLGFSEDTLSGKKKTDYRYWNIEPFSATVLDDPYMFYYLYLKVSKSATENSQGLSIGTGSWYISADPIEFEGDTDNYYLWVASLNSEENGDRQITNMYGLSEITPNMLRINNIASVDGNNYFKLLTNQFRMGDNKSSIEWNKNSDGKLAVKGSIVVSPSGDESPAEVDRGGFNSTKTYFVGDKIWYSGIAYVCISNAASTGSPDKDVSKWKPYSKEANVGIRNYLLATSTARTIIGLDKFNQVTVGYNIVNGSLEKADLLNKDITLTCKYKVEGLDKETRLAFVGDSTFPYFGETLLSPTNTEGLFSFRVKYSSTHANTTRINIRVDNLPTYATVKVTEMMLRTGNTDIDWVIAQEDIDTLMAETNAKVQQAQADAINAQSSVNDLNTYVDGAFKDGVVSEAEAAAIATHLKNVNETMAQLEATYNKLYANTYLEGTAKTSLLNAKINLFGARDNLVSAINTAIADNKVTTTEKNNVNSKYDLFNSAITTFNGAVEDANKAIQTKLDAISKGYADAAKKIADEAQKAADKAQETAQESKDRLNEWAKDSVISPTEKTALKQQAEDVKSEYQEISAQAARYNLTTTTEWAEYYSSYTKAIAAFGKYTKATPENIAIESDYSDIANYYPKRQVILDLIASKSKIYAEDLVNNIQTVGINLLRNTRDFRNTDYWVSRGGSNVLRFTVVNNNIRLEKISTVTGVHAYKAIVKTLTQGKEYTLTLRAKSSIAHKRAISTYNIASYAWRTTIGTLDFVEADTYYDFKFTFKEAAVNADAIILASSSNIELNQTIDFEWIKLEEGNKATPYTEAPEDIKAFIIEAEKQSKQAQADADKANGLLSDISNDNILTPNEKQDVLKEWDIIKSERATVVAQAQNLGLNASNYTVAYNALSAYLTPLLANLTVNSAITGSEFRAKFKAYYDAKIALLKDVTDKAKELADAAKKAADDAAKAANDALSEAQALDYLKKALAGSTTIDGGLLLTSMIQLGIIDAGKFVEKAGINGTAKNDNDVIAWFGGTLQEAVNNLASIVFRANGNAKIGQFDLSDGRLIGYKDGIERVQLTTDAIGSRENLLGTTQLYNNSYDGYSFSMDINSPTFTVVDVTQSFVLSSGDTIIADMDMALYLNSGSKSPNESLRIYVIKDGITIATADTSVAPLNYTITQNGTYSIRFHAYMTASYNEIEFTRGTYSSRFYANKVTSARKSVLASDGFASVWDETKYFMLSATQANFLEVKGTMKLTTPNGQQSIILDSTGIKFEGVKTASSRKDYLYKDSNGNLKLGS